LAGRRLVARAELATLPLRRPVTDIRPFDPAERAVRRRLWSCAVMGFLGSVLVFAGASQPTSPFTVASDIPKGAVAAPAWFFGVAAPLPLQNYTPPPGWTFYFGLAAFYGGLVLLMRAWVRLIRLTRERPGMPVRQLAIVMATWVLPMLFVAPLLSQDAYSYVAQGEMMTKHISPYLYGPYVLGQGGNVYTVLTARIWGSVTSPYGPLFLELAGWIQAVVNHSELGGLVLFRLEALAGVGLIAWFMPSLSRSIGKDAAVAFVFAVMNPIVLIHLIGGEHNDALMLGFLVAGLAFAARGNRVAGVVLVALATLVKVPAGLGILYIGWDWAGTRPSWGHRARMVVLAGAIGLAVMAVITQLVGLGWGWAFALGNPDTLRSYLDPATAVGLGVAKFAQAVGFGTHTDGLLTAARTAAAVLAVALGLRWLWRSEPGASSLKAIGLTMFVAVVLGPVMQPWYLAWSIVLLAPVATGYLRGALVWLTVIVTFLGLGNAPYMLTNLTKADPWIVVGAGLPVLVMLLWPVVPRVIWATRGGHGQDSGLGPTSTPEELAASV
jgi:hypothetical protein